MFWNLGYEGFADQPWMEVPSLTMWEAQSNSDSSAFEPMGTSSNADPTGIRLDYDPAQGFEEAVMLLPDPKVDWLRANGNQVFVELQNAGDAQYATFQVQLSNGQKRSSDELALKSGDNHIVLDKLFQSLPQAESQYNCKLPEVEPPHVIGMAVTLRGYSIKGSIYFNFHSVFNNKYVIYPGDPVENVTRFAATRWGQDLSTIGPVLKIDQGITCGVHTHPSLVKEGLPIEFNLANGLEHLDGYYIRYKASDNDIDQQGGTDGRSKNDSGWLDSAVPRPGSAKRRV